MIDRSPSYCFILLLIFVVGVVGVLSGCNGTSSSLTSPSVVSPSPTTTPIVRSEDTVVHQQTRIRELMKANPNCTLPCWWGITPGKTTWSEANDLLKAFATKIVYQSNGDSFSAGAFFNTPPKEISSSYILLSISGVGQIVQTIKVAGIEGALEMALPQLLSEYGQPSEIWINTFSSYIDNKPPFTVFLFYPEHGFLAQYDSDASIAGTTIRACANQVSVIRLWSPTRQFSFLDTLDVFDVHYDGRTLSSHDALEMDTKTFYQKFSNVEIACFETSKMKWLGIDGSTPAP